MRVGGCDIFGYKFNFATNFDCLESKPFSPKSGLTMRNPAYHNPEYLCLDSSDVVDDVVTGLLYIGGNKMSFGGQEAERDRFLWMSLISASCKRCVKLFPRLARPEYFGRCPHSSGVILDSPNNYVANLFHIFQGVVHGGRVDDVGCCVALGTSPLASAEFPYAREVVSCSGIYLGLQAKYVVCKAGEGLKAWVCLSSLANISNCYITEKIIVRVLTIISVDGEGATAELCFFLK